MRTQKPVRIGRETFVYCEKCGVLVNERYAQKALLDAFPDQLGNRIICHEDNIGYFCEEHYFTTSSDTVPNYEWHTDILGNGYWKELPKKK
jgi:predicted Rdx family selenoprotein